MLSLLFVLHQGCSTKRTCSTKRLTSRAMNFLSQPLPLPALRLLRSRAAFPVDTHIHRLAQRWGLTAGHSVEQTEADLKLVFPERLWRELHLQIIFFGREACPARSHDPAACPICSWAAVPPYDRCVFQVVGV